jgi:hypothetical protein
MKYIIIGMHCSGKQEVADILENNGIKCGRLFTNLDNLSTQSIYNSSNYEQYTSKDINEVFENNAYIFMQEFPFGNSILPMVSAFQYYEGLSLYEFDNNDVFVMSPDQLFAISPASINDDITFIWMDNPKKERLNRFHAERRTYNFYDREDIESRDACSFVKFLYNFDKSNVLYFTSEEPNRVAAIIYSLIKHPDLVPIFTEAFN